MGLTAEPVYCSSAATKSAHLVGASLDGASTMATSSGGTQNGIEDGAEARKDGIIAIGSKGHTRGTNGTVGTMKVGPASGSWFDGIDSHGGTGRRDGAGVSSRGDDDRLDAEDTTGWADRMLHRTAAMGLVTASFKVHALEGNRDPVSQRCAQVDPP